MSFQAECDAVAAWIALVIEGTFLFFFFSPCLRGLGPLAHAAAD